DPTCPDLSAKQVVSLRSLIDLPDRPWFLPHVLPPTVQRAAVVSVTPDAHAVFVGADRWLSLSPVQWERNITATSDLILAPWRIALVGDPQAGWQATLRQSSEGSSPAFV